MSRWSHDRWEKKRCRAYASLRRAVEIVVVVVLVGGAGVEELRQKRPLRGEGEKQTEKAVAKNTSARQQRAHRIDYAIAR